MGSQNILWSIAKKCFTFGLVGLTISDRYASIVPVQGVSMSPTFNPLSSTSRVSIDYVLVEKFCLQKYQFSHGDVVVFCVIDCNRTFIDTRLDVYECRRAYIILCINMSYIMHPYLYPTDFDSPTDHKEKHVKRITALPGDWISSPYSYDAVRVPEGHCWVEGDNFASSLDSRSFGPIPLGLVQGRVTHIVWPPQRVGKVETRVPHDGLPL